MCLVLPAKTTPRLTHSSLISHPPIPCYRLQLKAKLAKQKAAKDEHERRKNLTKYIPDVSRSLFSMLEIISDPTGVARGVGGGGAGDTARDAAARAAKRPSHLDALVDDVRAKRLKEETLAEKLRTHIEQCLSLIHISEPTRPY